MQLKAILLSAATLAANVALILLLTGTAEGLSNPACQDVGQHNSLITITPVYTGSPETLDRIRISWDTNPQGTHGFALHRAEADGETLERYQAGYWSSGYVGEITTETTDHSPEGRADYWYQIAWIAAGWEAGADTILACSNIASATGEWKDEAPTATPPPTATPVPPPTATPVPTSTQVAELTPAEEDRDDDSDDGGDRPSQPTPAPQPTATAVPLPTVTPVPLPTATPVPAPTATARPAPTPSGDANSDKNGDKNGGPKEEDLEVSTTAQPNLQPVPTATVVPTPTPTKTPAPPVFVLLPAPPPTRSPGNLPVPLSAPTTVPQELEPTPTPTPIPTAPPPQVEPQPPQLLQPQLEPTKPKLPFIGEALPRLRSALEALAATPRQRTTLVVALAVTLLFAGAVFIHLLLRRR